MQQEWGVVRMWETLEIERELKQALIGEFGESQGETLYGEYTAARDKLLPIWHNVKRTEPDLTDHGPDHIADVMKQAHDITPADHLQPREQLALLLSILFHDTGNIHGREGHEKKVSHIYDHVRGTPTPSFQEKKIVLSVVGAHGGEARNGSKDTIRDLPHTEAFLKKPIRMQEIAAILRFADELAEGKQRTCEYLRRIQAFDINSEKYHDYADITEICVDRGNQRVALTYHIGLTSKDGDIDADQLDRLKRLLTFAYHRIRKLDEERQYARFYSTCLGDFKTTSATLTFWLDGRQLNLGLEPLELTDLVVPGGATKSIPELNNAYEIDDIAEKLKAECTPTHFVKEQEAK